MLDTIASPWLPATFLVVVSLAFRSRSGSWFAPSAFAGLLWSGYLCSTLLALGSRVPALGFWVIASLVIVIQSAAALAEHDAGKTRDSQILDERRLPALQVRVRQACLIFNAVSLAGCVFFVFASFQYFDLSLNFASLLRIGGLWTLQRYDYIMDPWPLRIAAIWPYPAAVLGGMLWSLARERKEKILSVLSLVPALLISLMLGGRAGFLMGLVFWLSALWTTDRARTGTNRKLFKTTNLTLALGTSAGLLFFFVLIFGLRDLANSENSDLTLVANSGQIRNYMFGAPIAFSHWFESSDRGLLGYGALTFPGFFDITGLRPRTIGTYTDYVNTTGLEVVNIFTIFRGLIQDFTLFGTILLCATLGFVSGRLYSRPSLCSKFVLGLSAYYALILFSPLYNVFGFNSSILAWIVAWYVLKSVKSREIYSVSPQPA